MKSILMMVALLGVSGCFVPIERGEAEYFQESTLSFIEVGKTTKQEVATSIAELIDSGEATAEVKTVEPLKFKGGDWWLYAQLRKEARWLVIGLAGGAGDMGISGDVDHRFLLIKFGDDGRVASFERSSSEGLGCNRQNICIGPGTYVLLASESMSATARDYDEQPGQCGVYVYGKPSIVTEVAADGRPVGWLVNEKGFLFMRFAEGTHRLQFKHDYAEHEPVEFTCSSHDPIFFEVRARRTGIFMLDYNLRVDRKITVEGRKDIDKSRLLLVPESDALPAAVDG